MSTGILVHGRHVDAEGWEKLVWGEPPFKMGSVPTMVLEALNLLHQTRVVIVFGTGASERMGLKEAEYTRRFLRERFSGLMSFEAIRTHREFREEKMSISMDDSGLCFQWPGPDFEEPHTVTARCSIICETSSQNTVEEIENAAKIFAAQDVGKVIQISCGSHIARCIVNQLQVRESGGIPANQRWYAVADHMTFGGGPIQKTVTVLEKPHRGDDPMLESPVMSHEVVTGLFGLSAEQRIGVLTRLKRDIENTRASKGA